MKLEVGVVMFRLTVEFGPKFIGHKKRKSGFFGAVDEAI